MNELRPRFLMVVSQYPPRASAGMERACQRLSAELAARGFAVHVLTQEADGMPAEAVEDVSGGNGVHVHRVLRPLALGPLWGITYMRQVAAWMRRNAAAWDFCLCHQLYLHSSVAAPLARRLGKHAASLLVHSGPGNDIEELHSLRFGRHFLRLALTSPAQFVLSEQGAKELVATGYGANRIWRYANFVDVDRFAPAGEHSPHEFLYVGRFHPVKNLPLLVRAFTRVHASRPEARLRLVGGGPAEADVRAAVAASPARDAISMDGWTGDPAREYQRCLATVTSTITEGQSNTLVESIACGAPAITPDVSGVRDTLDPDGMLPPVIPPGEYAPALGGLVTPRQDEAALASAMKAILADPALRARLSARGRARALQAYSPAVSVADFVARARRITSAEPASDAERGFPHGMPTR